MLGVPGYIRDMAPALLNRHWLVVLSGLTLASLLAGCSRNAVRSTFDREENFGRDFTGFHLADPLTGEVLFSQEADKLYTPASNTKLLTTATCLAWLPNDSLPVLSYRYDGDTLRLWGLAYPDLAANSKAYNERIRRLLRAHPGELAVSLHAYAQLPRFGSGWMWDDYNSDYMRERSGLPVYGNALWTVRQTGTWTSKPSFLVVRDSGVLPKGVLSRAENSNRFEASAKTASGDTLVGPLFGAQQLVAQLLEDWLGRTVRYHAEPLPEDWRSRVWNGEPRDSLIRAMMLPSDNFLAEQLLLSAGLVAHGLTDGDVIRERAASEVLGLAPPNLYWADGSGLSHYNMVTPKSIVELLTNLYTTYPWAQLERLLVKGGVEGTIANNYADEAGRGPYIYGKTGTLRHNHCLSGFVRATSGRMLAFSFMHNHFSGSSAEYKASMERVLIAVRDKY